MAINTLPSGLDYPGVSAKTHELAFSNIWFLICLAWSAVLLWRRSREIPQSTPERIKHA
jgi:hypothetical protein